MPTELELASGPAVNPLTGQIIVPASAASGTAIMAAQAALPANGGTIVLGAGTHTLDVPVRFNKNLIIEGVGDVATIVRFDPANGPGFAMADTTQRRIVMQNFRIDSTVPGTGTAIDASKFITSRFVCMRVGASTTAPNIGISFPIVGSYYNHIVDSVITVSGAAPIGIEYAAAANRNVITNTKVNVLGSSTGTGVRVGALAHSMLFMGLDIEFNDCIAVDVEATAHDVTLVGCYLEQNTINLRLAAGVESVRLFGGYISNAITTDIQDNGAVGFNVPDVWLNFNPYSRRDDLNVTRSRVNGINTPGNFYVPEDHGLKAWTYDPAIVSAQSAAVNGSLYLCQLNFRYPDVITELLINIQTGAVTPVANQNFLGLIDAAGTLVAASAAGALDVPSSTSGVKAIALSAPYNLAAAGKLWAVLLMNAATPAIVFRSGTTLAASPGLAAAAARFARNGTALTALPASITPASNDIASALGFWVGAR